MLPHVLTIHDTITSHCSTTHCSNILGVGKLPVVVTIHYTAMQYLLSSLKPQTLHLEDECFVHSNDSYMSLDWILIESVMETKAQVSISKRNNM